MENSNDNKSPATSALPRRTGSQLDWYEVSPKLFRIQNPKYPKQSLASVTEFEDGTFFYAVAYPFRSGYKNTRAAAMAECVSILSANMKLDNGESEERSNGINRSD